MTAPRLPTDPQELIELGQKVLEEDRRRRAITDPSGYIPQAPWPKQQEFLDRRELEVLFGGAAGGSKTSALLMAALQYVHIPSYSALILRRSYSDLSLPGAIMDRAETWLRGSAASWNGTDKRWTFPSGAVLQFGYCDSEADLARYKSAEFAFIGIDELTEWPEKWYQFLFSRLRKARTGPLAAVPLRMRSATNPDGIGSQWVRRRFGIPEGEVIAKTIQATPQRAFVPSRLEDNPALDAESYELALAQLDPVKRMQLREGRWVRDAGGLVYKYDPGINGILKLPTLEFKLLAMDFGVTNACSFNVLGWLAHDPATYVATSFKKEGLSPSDASEIALELIRTEKPVQVIGDVGGLGKAFAKEMTERYAIPVEAADKQNKRGYIALINGDLTHGRLKVYTPACGDLIAEYAELPWNKDATAEAAGFPNHCSDGVLYGWRASRAFTAKPREDKPKPGTSEWAEHLERISEEQLDEELAGGGREYWERLENQNARD